MVISKVKEYSSGAVAKASLNRRKFVAIDPKPCDLSMGRVKLK